MAEADRTGQQFGKYRLIHLLGNGPLGAVYLAEQGNKAPIVAVKVFRAQLTPDNVEVFNSQARAAAQLTDSHIVQTHGFGVVHRDEGNIPYLVMEYARNGTLRRQHPRGTRLPLDTIILYVEQIAAALQYAHNQKYLHCNIKPENMLLGASNEVLLSDFGIAAVAYTTGSQRMQEQNIIGTQLYMAPEQWQGHSLPATDQYALGVVVYEWICGECPFQGSASELKRQHCDVSPQSLCKKISTLSAAVEEVVMIALRKDPKERFATVEAFATALKTASQITHIPVVPVQEIKPVEVEVPLIHELGSKSERGSGGRREMVDPDSPSTDPYTTPQPEKHKPWWRRSALLTSKIYGMPCWVFIPPVVVILLASFFYGVLSLFPITPKSLCSVNYQSANAIPVNRTGTHPSSDGELVGLSEGGIIFDCQSSNSIEFQDKLQAANDITKNDSQGEDTQWKNAINLDQTDAESQIYFEDHQVFSTENPYITIIVGVTFQTAFVWGERGILQGAFTEQKEYNDQHQRKGELNIVLMIANIGTVSDPGNALALAKQIAQQAATDKTIVGIMGWPISAATINMRQDLQNDKSPLPIVSPSSSTDDLTNKANLFRVCPTDKDQARLAATAMLKKLKQLGKKNPTIAIFVGDNIYSRSLADDFYNDIYTQAPGVVKYEYTITDQDSVQKDITKLRATTPQPDAIFFASYVSDLIILLNDIFSTPYARLPIVGGDALAITNDYAGLKSLPVGLDNVQFTAFASPNEWNGTGQKPSFFKDYSTNFYPYQTSARLPNGLPSIDIEVMLSYDAMTALLHGVQQILSTKNTITPITLKNAIVQITGTNAIQGVSGRISFGPTGDPQNKIIILEHIQGTSLQQDQIQGCLRVTDDCP